MNSLLARLNRLAYLPILVYSVILSRHALRAHFSNDDPMNMAWAWRDGIWFQLWHIVTFWTTAYRPMGQLYYLSIYRIFGLNPLPYRIVILCFVAANAYLSYRLAERITGSRTVAFLTGLFVCAHASMVDLYYQNDIIYDVLAYFFSMLTLLRYVSIRKQGVVPSPLQALSVVCLFIAALNSKEMSSTLAGFVLAYEVIFHGLPAWNGAAILSWIKREGRLPLILILLTGIYTLGKLLGPNSLTQDPNYQLHLSLDKYLQSNLHHWNDLLYLFAIPSTNMLIAIDVVLVSLLLFFKRNPAVRWCCFYALVAPLPVSFVQMQRGGTGLYLALFGWAMLAAIILAKLTEILAPAMEWPLFRIPANAIRVALVIGVTYFYVSTTMDRWRSVPAANIRDQEQTWSMFSQLQKLPFKPRPRTSVLFMDEPFGDYRMLFISQLVWDDHTVNIELARQPFISAVPAKAEEFESVLTIEGDRIRVVRP